MVDQDVSIQRVKVSAFPRGFSPCDEPVFNFKFSIDVLCIVLATTRVLQIVAGIHPITFNKWTST